MTITYEDIYELLRAEKYSADLQPLKPKDLIKIKEYFELKEDILKKQKSSSIFFDRSKQDKILTEIENAWRALRDLYERREKKIINRALFSSRTKLKDSTNMLASEEKLYSILIDLLGRNNVEFFENFGIKVKYESEKEGPEPKVEEAQSEQIQMGPAKSEDFARGLVKTTAAPLPPKDLKEEKVVAVQTAKEPDLAISSEADNIVEIKKQKIIRFTEPVSELIGTDLQTYGPFEKEDVANLPEELANLLLKQNKAKEIATNESR